MIVAHDLSLGVICLWIHKFLCDLRTDLVGISDLSCSWLVYGLLLLQVYFHDLFSCLIDCKFCTELKICLLMEQFPPIWLDRLNYLQLSLYFCGELYSHVSTELLDILTTKSIIISFIMLQRCHLLAKIIHNFAVIQQLVLHTMHSTRSLAKPVQESMCQEQYLSILNQLSLMKWGQGLIANSSTPNNLFQERKTPLITSLGVIIQVVIVIRTILF